MSRGRFKVEYLGKHSHLKPDWYETKEDLEASLEFMKSCPIDDGPVEVRITEFSPTSVRRESWG